MEVIGPSLRHQRRSNSNYVVTPSGGKEIKEEKNIFYGENIENKEKNNMNNLWKKSNLLDRFENWCYFEDIGLVRNLTFTIYPIDKNEKLINSYYLKNSSSNRYERKNVASKSFEVFEQELYRLKDSRFYSYSVEDKNVEEIKVSQYKVDLSFEKYDGKGSTRYNKEILISNKIDLKEISFYTTNSTFIPRKPIYIEIKLGDEYYHCEKGLCTVTELFDYPNKENKFCEIETKNKEKIIVKWDDPSLFYVPYNQPSNELVIFEESKNDLKLQPYILKEADILNVMWQPIDEAVCYIVKLYKYMDKSCYKTLYHLKDYEVNRNEHILCIDKLIGKDFCIVIIAEDRNGNELAKSKGIKI